MNLTPACSLFLSVSLLLFQLSILHPLSSLLFICTSIHLPLFSLCKCLTHSSFPFSPPSSRAPLLIAQFLLFSTYLLQFDAFHLAWIILPLSIHLRLPFSSALKSILIHQSLDLFLKSEYIVGCLLHYFRKIIFSATTFEIKWFEGICL